ncbi:MAG TPA: MFS transporter [Gemmatimonadaceae bacterium]
MGLTTEPTDRDSRRPLSKWPFSFGAALNPWRNLAGMPREVWLLFATNLINRAGMMVLPFLLLYLTRELGFSASRAGFVFAVYGATAIVFGPVSGRLSDRLGAVPVMRVSLLGAGSVLFAFQYARTFTSVVLMTIAWAACAELFRPASLAAVTHAVDITQRKPAFALNRLAINLGMSIGPALGGFLATVSFRAMFVVDSLTTLIAGMVLTLTPWKAASHVERGDERESSLDAPAMFDSRLIAFLVAAVLVSIVFFQHEATLPLYLVQDLRLSPAFYGMLFTINTLLIVALEVPINSATAHWPNTRLLVAGCLLFAIGFGALAAIHSARGVILTTIVWTFGEMLLFPAMVAHLGEIAPDHRRGAYMGAYSMSLSIALTIGPWLGTQILSAFGAPILWTAMFALGSLAALLMAFSAPRLAARSAAAGAES